MDSMTLFIASLAVSCIGALASVLLIKADNAAKTAGCLIGAVAAVLSFIAGLEAVLGDVSSLNTVFFFPFARLELLLNGLAGLIVVLISILAFAGFIYGLSYFDEYPGKVGRAGFFMNTFVASMMLVITADNVFWFLVAFELMSLTSYFLVVIEENKNSIRGGWLYFVIAHVGFVLIMASFLLMTNGVGGSFSFSDFRTHDFGPAVSSACFVLAFFGFGAKAGIIPLHSWLPQAHPEAPSNVSALMSGGMIKIGILGILKVGLDLLAGSGVQLWWGLMVLVFGSISSVLGVVYALHEHDIKRLLAYHSVENIGIILLGVGASMTAHALGNDVIQTPHMDELVRRGTSFTRAHIPGGTLGAVCMPSRAMLNSGRTLFHLSGEGQDIPAEHITLGECLRGAGYHTHGVGKWHNGPDSYARSFCSGADIFFGGMWDHWNVPVCDYNPNGQYEHRIHFTPNFSASGASMLVRADRINAGVHSTDLLSGDAVRFIQSYNEEKPFFLYLSFLAPHDPRTMPEEFKHMYKAEDIPARIAALRGV